MNELIHQSGQIWELFSSVPYVREYATVTMNLLQDLSKLVEQSLLMMQGQIGSMLQGVSPPQGIVGLEKVSFQNGSLPYFKYVLYFNHQKQGL